MKLKLIGGVVAVCMLAACGGTTETDAPANAETETKPAAETPATPVAEPTIDGGVEITLQTDLDGILNSYCLDIAGGNKNVDPAKGLQAHTCYSYRGDLGTDQIFDPAQFSSNVLYMPVYDVCATLSGLSAGSSIGLAACEDGELQAIVFSGTGTISPLAAPEMCFTAATDTRFGRGSQHQIKNLSLEACSDDLSEYQLWRTRATDD